MTFKRLASFAIALPVSLFVASTIHIQNASAAQDSCTWTGTGGSANMTDATNWSGCDNGNVPEVVGPTPDNLVFPAGVPSKTVNNDFPNASEFATITFAASGYTLSGNSMIPANITQTGTEGMFTAENEIAANLESSSMNILNSSDYGLTLLGNVAISGSTPLTINASAGPIYFLGIISGAGTITKDGNSDAVFIGVNTYTGSTAVNDGVVRASSNSGLGSPSAGTTVAVGASLQYVTDSAAEVHTSNEPLTLSGSGATAAEPTLEYLSVYSTNKSFVQAGTVSLGTADVLLVNNLPLTISGVVSGVGGIEFAHSNGGASETSVLTGNNTYTGTTTVTTKVTVNGSQSSSPLIIEDGGILQGSGTIGVLTVQTGGRIAPGNSPGCITAGNTTLSGNFDVEIGGSTACTQYDQLAVNGTVNVTGGTLNLSRFNGFTPALNQTYTIVLNDSTDAVTGTFAGLAQGGTVTIDGYTFTISYVGGDGNDVVVTVTGISAAAAAAAAAVPGTPRTGLGLIMANPMLTIATTLASSATLFAIARKYGLFVK